MNEQALDNLPNKMTVQERIATCLQLWAVDKVDEGRQILEEAPPEQWQQMDYYWAMVGQVWRLRVFACLPLMQAVIYDIQHLLTIQMAGCLGAETLMALGRIAKIGNADINIYAEKLEENETVRIALESARTFLCATGFTDDEMGIPTGFLDVDVSVSDQPDFIEDRGKFRKLWLVTILDRARRDYRDLRAVQIAFNSLAASLGISSLEGVVESGFEQELQQNLADLRERLERMLTEDQIEQLEPTDAEIKDILRSTSESSK